MRTLEDSTYRIGIAWVSVSERTVSRHGEVIRLRPKNFELLLFLIHCRERIATKEDIFRQIWPGVAVTENTLVKSIIDIRKALGDDLRKPQLLRSIPKVGYQLVGVSEATAADTPAPPLEEAAIPAALPEPSPETPRASRRKTMLYGAAAIAAILLVATASHVLVPGRIAAPAGDAQWEETAWWRLDEGQGDRARDSSGHGLDGALTHGVSWAPKEAGGGLIFSGFDAAVTGRTRGLLPAGDSARTVSAWMKLQLPQLANLPIFAYGRYSRDPTALQFGLGTTMDGKLDFGSSVDDGNAASNTKVDDGSWHMVTVTYDGLKSSTARIFVDGNLDRETHFEKRPATVGDAPWKIGQELVEGTDFRGALKDIRVYSRALAPSQVAALYSCSTNAHDLGEYYYLPVMMSGFLREPREAGSSSTPFTNAGQDFGGMQLARSDGTCAERRVRGADVGQDLSISLEVRLPTGGAGLTSIAGPYFRSRSAGAGDGLLGGASAGYWVQLHSTGMVSVRRLNPMSVVAYSQASPAYRPEAFNLLKVEARGNLLQVWLNGEVIAFDQGGRRLDRVEIPPVWETSAWKGENQGTAGVAFSDEMNRGRLGGQQIRNLTVTRID